MQSWQSRLIKIVFRFRSFLKPPTGKFDIEKNRQELEALAASFKTKVKFESTSVIANGVPAEWIIPPKESGEKVILYLHGGAYNSGSIASHRSIVANIANAARGRALILDYRLAPEDPFPAAVEDALAGYRWLLDHQIPADHIIVAGDSCGGGLALSLLVSLRDADEALPAAAVCISPWTDLTCSGESWHTNAKKDIMLEPVSLKHSAKLYLGDTDPRDPLASPLYADMKGLPPIFIQVGSDELILSDATGVAEKAQVSGVDVTLQVLDGMQHEWHFAANLLPEGKRAIKDIGQFIQAAAG